MFHFVATVLVTENNGDPFLHLFSPFFSRISCFYVVAKEKMNLVYSHPFPRMARAVEFLAHRWQTPSPRVSVYPPPSCNAKYTFEIDRGGPACARHLTCLLNTVSQFGRVFRSWCPTGPLYICYVGPHTRASLV
jgi:hypothetical protein